MGKFNCLVLKIILGIFAATNFVSCIITTDFQVLVTVNIVVAVVCSGIFLFIESKFSALAIDLAISKKAARKLVGDYFVYYKNVERVTIDEYLEILSGLEKAGLNKTPEQS